MLFPKARVFISYARGDLVTAEWLFQELQDLGFTVYLDTRGTLAGERFLTIIVQQLQRCDAVLALISGCSAVSPWCQAELYYAHAMRRPILPIRIDPDRKIQMPSPLELLQRETQFVTFEGEHDRAMVKESLRERFRVIRRRAYIRWTRRVGTTLAVMALLAWGLHSGFSNVLREWERRAILLRVERAQKGLPRESMESGITRFANDESLRSRLLLMAEDPERPMHTRLNAHILAAALGRPQARWYLESLNWSHSMFGSGELTDVTFRTGIVKDVQFAKISFAGIVWDKGPEFGISGSTFEACQFNGGQFAQTNVIDSDFINCVFQGTILDVTNFGAVRFSSRSANPASEVISAGELCSFENAVIANCSQPSAPNVMDFRGPKNEVMFTEVVFESCRFRGSIRPSWFKKCSFSRCTFPPSVRVDELAKNENHVNEFSTIDEGCP